MVDSVDFDGDPKDYLDFFDFPLEDVDGGSEKDFWNGMQSLELPSDMSMCFSSSLCGGIQNDFSDNKNLSLSVSPDIFSSWCVHVYVCNTCVL